MTHYIDIKIKENTKRKKNRIRNNLFMSLHKRFFELKNKTIGVSFPEKNNDNLGLVLRIHGKEDELLKLNVSENIKDRDVVISEVESVPKDHSFINIRRVQSNLSNSKLNRLIKRNNLTKKEILLYRKKMLSGSLSNFFVEVESNSSGSLFKFFFSFSEKDRFSPGEFNNYGVSKDGTVPFF